MKLLLLYIYFIILYIDYYISLYIIFNSCDDLVVVYIWQKIEDGPDPCESDYPVN